KIVSVFQNNPSRGLEIVQATYLLLDAETGVPLSLMDGRFITGIRTAATSAVATKFLSDPAAKRLAVFGAGVQAKFHTQAMFEVAEISEVLIVSRNPEKARALADEVLNEHKVAVELA